MRIHLEGDWSAAWAFGLAAIPMSIAAFYAGSSTDAHIRVVQSAIWGVAILYGIIAIAMGVFAKRGREVPEGSTWVSWENTGFDVWAICGSALFLYFAGFGSLVFYASAALSSMHDVAMLCLVLVGLLVAAWGVAWMCLSARIMVFTPEKDVLLLKGRPCSFLKMKFRSKECVGLHVSWDQGYAGGMYHDHPDNLYFVWGIYPEGPVKLNTVNIPMETKRADGIRMIHEMVEETAAMVGQPVPPWPEDKDIYLRLDRED